MNKRVKHFIGGLLACMLAVSAIFAGNTAIAKESDTNIPATSWMETIPGDTMLSDISIPGTHDSATQYISPSFIFQCQDTSIPTQLENGYRYLDIRLKLAEDKEGNTRLQFIHNFANCRAGRSLFSEKLYLDDVLPEIYDFLEQNPSEAVIFTVKAENSKDSVADFQNVLYQYISQNPDAWYLENRIPSLDQVRGKIVLATRFDDANEVGELSRGLNFTWEEQGNKEAVELPYAMSMINDTEALWVQDHYKYNIETKTEAVMEDLMNCQAREDTFSINFLSTTGTGLFGHPKKYARALNAAFLETALNSNTSYGIIVVDFATKELAEHIYLSNF